MFYLCYKQCKVQQMDMKYNEREISHFLCGFSTKAAKRIQRKGLSSERGAKQKKNDIFCLRLYLLQINKIRNYVKTHDNNKSTHRCWFHCFEKQQQNNKKTFVRQIELFF